MPNNDWVSRRMFLGGSMASALLPSAGIGQPALPARELLPSPIFPTNPDTVPLVTRTGLRPFRRDGYRLGLETIGSKYVIHNYGYGGAGITMSWGCAEQVGAILSGIRSTLPSLNVAVLGGGVMGMTAALVLLEAGLKVSLYASEFTPNTTSDVAGGQWAPSVVETDNAARHDAILAAAFRRHIGYGARYGVSRRWNYTHFTSPDLDAAVSASGLKRERLEILPFRRVFSGGYRYDTLLVEPPIFLTALHSDLRARGARFNTRHFQSISEISALSEPTIINCLGLGAREVWSDTGLIGRKGVLAMLPPQENLRYLYSGIGYMFPRKDHLVIGGSLEWENRIDGSLTDSDKARLMIKVIRAVFQGAIPVPDWLSGNSRILGADMIRSTDQYGGGATPAQTQ